MSTQLAHIVLLHILPHMGPSQIGMTHIANPALDLEGVPLHAL